MTRRPTRRLPVAWGRWSPAQSARFGSAVGSVGYLAVGPVIVLVSLPRRLRVEDPTLIDLNEHLRQLHERRDLPSPD